jgi:molybdopterin molybdotransferase
MLSVDEALKAVLSRARALAPAATPIADALGLALAEEVRADGDWPAFDKSVVDGYALRSADHPGPSARFRVVGEIAAGRVPDRALGPGEGIMIMTGAPLPPGADAVVMFERTRDAGDGTIEAAGPLAPGQNAMRRGSEMRAGELVLSPGDRLTPPRLGVLASVGRASAGAIPRPRAAILATGDELVDPAQAPGPGQIRNSNGSMLAGLCRGAGAVARELPIARDRAEELRERLRDGLREDILLVSGGVSAGRYDLVPAALAEVGVEAVFHKVRVKPGKPLWFGAGPARGDRPGALVFGLPGNPVSGLVSFLLFVRPALDALAGFGHHPPRPASCRLSRPFAHRGDRPTYHPARWVDPSRTIAEPLAWAGSGDLLTVAKADGFVAFPPRGRGIRDGGRIRLPAADGLADDRTEGSWKPPPRRRRGSREPGPSPGRWPLPWPARG